MRRRHLWIYFEGKTSKIYLWVGQGFTERVIANSKAHDQATKTLELLLSKGDLIQSRIKMDALGSSVLRCLSSVAAEVSNSPLETLNECSKDWFDLEITKECADM